LQLPRRRLLRFSERPLLPLLSVPYRRARGTLRIGAIRSLPLRFLRVLLLRPLPSLLAEWMWRVALLAAGDLTVLVPCRLASILNSGSPLVRVRLHSAVVVVVP